MVIVLDENVSLGKKALLVTRDYHFTNSLRFPPGDVFAVLYLKRGTLAARDEIALVSGVPRGS